MKDERYYLNILKQSIEKENLPKIKDEDVDRFRTLVLEQFSAYYRAYVDREYTLLEEYLNTQRSFRRKIVKELSESQEQILISAAQFAQNFAVFNKLLQMQNEKAGFEEEFKVVELNCKHTKEVVTYLYSHVNAQHKAICEAVGIAKSSLSDLMKMLEKIKGVEVISCKKATFYNLTNEARSYLKEQIEKEKEKEVIDVEIYQEEVDKFIYKKYADR